MAAGSINVNVRGAISLSDSSSNSIPNSEPKKLKEPVKRVEVKLKDTSVPTNTEILNQLALTMRLRFWIIVLTLLNVFRSLSQALKERSSRSKNR